MEIRESRPPCAVPESGLLADPASKQMHDMFWQYLAEDLAEKGGIGLSDEIYRQMSQMGAQAEAPAMEQLL